MCSLYFLYFIVCVVYIIYCCACVCVRHACVYACVCVCVCVIWERGYFVYWFHGLNCIVPFPVIKKK